MRLVTWIAVGLIALKPSLGYAQVAVPPLRLDLACAPQSFRATLQNVSARETAVVIGMVFGNDQKYVDGVVMVVRQAGLPDVELQYMDLTAPVTVAGNAPLPWVVTLSPGGAFSVDLPARYFRRAPSLTEETFSRPAVVSLRLTTQPSWPGGIPVWIGTLTSNGVAVPGGCH